MISLLRRNRDFRALFCAMSISLVASGALAEITGPRLPTLMLAAVSGLWGIAYLTLTRPLRRAEAAAPGPGRAV